MRQYIVFLFGIQLALLGTQTSFASFIHDSELRFIERSNNPSLIGSMIPASCESNGYKDPDHAEVCTYPQGIGEINPKIGNTSTNFNTSWGHDPGYKDMTGSSFPTAVFYPSLQDYTNAGNMQIAGYNIAFVAYNSLNTVIGFVKMPFITTSSYWNNINLNSLGNVPAGTAFVNLTVATCNKNNYCELPSSSNSIRPDFNNTARFTLVAPPSTAIHGECSTSDPGVCVKGNATNFSSMCNGYSTWTCEGISGGLNASCSIFTSCPVSPQCSTTANQCLAGTPGDFSGDVSNYTWTCTGSGVVSCSAPKPSSPAVTLLFTDSAVSIPSPTINLSINGSTVTNNQTINLTSPFALSFTTTNAQNGCTLNGTYVGSALTNPSYPNPAVGSNNAYTLICTNSSNVTTTFNFTLTNVVVPPPTITLRVNGNQVTHNQTITITSPFALQLDTVNAYNTPGTSNGCTLNGAEVNTVLPYTSGYPAPASGATVPYTLICKNSSNVTTTLNFNLYNPPPPLPTITSMSVNGTSLSNGGQITVSSLPATIGFSANNAQNGCNINGTYVGNSSGSYSAQSSGTYTLYCYNSAAQSTSHTVTINYTPPPPPTPTFWINNNSGSSVTISASQWNQFSSSPSGCPIYINGGNSGQTTYVNIPPSTFSPYVGVTASFYVICSVGGASAAKSVYIAP